MDQVKKLRELALATRLKRLSDRLTRDISFLYKQMKIDFEARWFTMISALRAKSPIAVTELAEILGITHTAVNQLAKELIKKGYIISGKNEKDERQRLLSLSRRGEELFNDLSPLWKEIKIANKELIDTVDANFLATLSRLEEELDKSSMYERVWLKVHGSLPGKIEILEYSPRLKKYFRNLNYEWLEEYFTIEDKDRSILQHPKEKIIDKGGIILFAILDDEVVGTCAIIRHPDNKYELAKMAVTKKYRNRGIGKKLMEAAIKWAKKKSLNKLFLLTNEKLISANVLYKNFGFIRMDNNPFNDTAYERKTYAMILDISSN